MEVGGKVSFSEAWSGRDFPYKSRSVLTWSVHPLWLSGPKLSKGSFHLKWPHTLTACRASSLRAFYFPACPGELNMLFPHSHGFPFCLECFSYSSLLFLPCPPPFIQLMCWDLSQRSFLQEVFTNPPKWIIFLSVPPTVLFSYLQLLQITLVNALSPFPGGFPSTPKYMKSLCDVALFYSCWHLSTQTGQSLTELQNKS